MAEQQAARLLDVSSVADHLRRRGLLDQADEPSARALGGGVSNTVLAVNHGERHWIVKQSLPELRVADHWPAAQRRVVTEAAALTLAGTITPGAVPKVLDVDAGTFTIVIEAAPSTWTNWKEDLLDGHVDVAVAATLGGLVGHWHHTTADDREVRAEFNDVEAFDQLRVDPYYRTTAGRRPELSDVIEGYRGRMAESATCLVHGDLSPKNVLVGPAGEVWVLDFEVAHYGDPAFDVAFLLHHLAMKAVHRRDAAEQYQEAAEAFVDCYLEAVEGQREPLDLAYVVGHVGCLLAARVDGKSPAEYLTESERSFQRAVAAEAVGGQIGCVEELFSRIREGAVA